MRLRSLEIQGFKSFPDKTKLEFGSGITAVVGPNGSGKSNIADAVRWALGEQSTRTLRGSKMEDVIFGGTQARKSIGYAMVQLVIDNSDRRLPDQDDEIIITRRLYRSGESEYRINASPVRLKDIHELFMDTGLGRDGYAVIGQGRIAEIVSAKSRDRREIFEEAAGISKYRYRKNDAERRLVQAEENLVRLRDILDELEARVEPLRIQAGKAREFLNLSEEKKQLELSLWLLKLDELKEQLRERENRINICKNEYALLERESEELEEQIEAVYEKSRQYNMMAEEKRVAIKAAEDRRASVGADIAVRENDIRHNEESIRKLEEELTGAGGSAEELGVLFREKQAAVAQAEQELAAFDERIQASEQRLSEQLEQIERLTGEIDRVTALRDSTQAAISETRLELAAGASSLSEGQTRAQALAQSGKEHDSVILELEEALGECREQLNAAEDTIQSLTNTQAGYTLKKESREKKCAEIKSRLEELEQSAGQKAQKARLLEDLEKNMEGFSGGVRHILRESGRLSGILGPVSSLISVDSRYTLAVETALGPAMQNVVVSDEDTAKKAIRILRDAAAGRATFLPLTTVRGQKADKRELEKDSGFIGIASELVGCDARFSGIVDRLLGRVAVVEDLDAGTRIARATGYKLRVVTLDGQVINAGGSYTGGSTVKSVGVLGRRLEIEKLASEARALREQAEALRPDLRAAGEEVSAMEAFMSGLISELQTAQENRVRLQAQLVHLEQNLTQALRNRDDAQKELEALQARIQMLEGGEADKTAMLEALAAKNAELEETIAAALSRRDMLGVGEAASRQDLSERKMARLSAGKDLETLIQEAERIAGQIDSTGARSAKLRDEQAELVRGNDATRQEIARLREESDRLLEQTVRDNEAIAGFMEKRTELEAETTDLRRREREASTKRELVSRDLAAHEERRIAVQGEYDGILTKMWDEYELSRSQAEQVAMEIPDRDKSNRRLGELRAKIRSLGTVNVEAIEEYAQVNERYTFLKAQVTDVENARDGLNRMISDLTREMRIRFEESFSRIAGQFSKVFVQLFGGGQASLSLSEEEDILEAGIEIHVQPPGKVIKSLSLLSGGEQAFVAIAIYFAILQVRPAPFCLLDEIEAALDDVNVVRFAAYLRRMCDKTQFIAITHRRGTMEEADTLYGVTMQEEGVSKLLELKVSELEKAMEIL